MRWPIWRVAVAERSMEPVLRHGDWLLVWRGLRPGRPLHVRRGQIVVARHPERPGLLLIKRAAWREPGGWYLMSDNPGAGAVDSGRFGVVPPGLIEGTLLLRYHRGGLWGSSHGPDVVRLRPLRTGAAPQRQATVRPAGSSRRPRCPLPAAPPSPRRLQTAPRWLPPSRRASGRTPSPSSRSTG